MSGTGSCLGYERATLIIPRISPLPVHWSEGEMAGGVDPGNEVDGMGGKVNILNKFIHHSVPCFEMGGGQGVWLGPPAAHKVPWNHQY